MIYQHQELTRKIIAYIPEEKILLLLGGNKNGQGRDIKEAKKILSKYVIRKK